ncbi:MAG: BamA/TamA family outer membrane protein [Sedimentisphaerales bacterium]|nr:BamA/TamA family outer membrane protein [Sedimentisphaerales bacterium]
MQDAIILFFVTLAWLGVPGPSAVAAEVVAAPDANDVARASDANEPASASGKLESAAAAGGQGEIIKSIEFEGNRKFKDHVLRERLGFALGEGLDSFLAEGGRLTIAEVYRKIGYAFVEVALDRDLLADGHLFYRIEEGPRVQIDAIEFVGNEAIGTGTLKAVIKTAEKKWWLWPYYYTEDAIDEDLDRLREFYYDQGYLDYNIKAETEMAAEEGRVRLVFVIDEGPVYRVGDIVITGNTHFTDEEVQARMELGEGRVYRRPTARRDARNLARLYQGRGFVDAAVRQSPRFTPKAGENLVTVEFSITEGKRFRIGRIDVTGNEVTQDKAIRHVLDEYGFTPGEWYNARMAPREGNGLLEKYVQRSVGAQQVLIRPMDPPGGPDDRKDARVDVEEGMTGLIMPGVGVSSDSGVVGRLVFKQQNFDITDPPEDIWDLLSMKAFRGAGQRLSLTLQPGTQYSTYYVNFVDPYWRDRPTSLDVMGSSWERYRESYDEDRLKASVGFEQRLENRWRRSLGFRAENVDVQDLDLDAPQEIIDVKGDNQLFGVRLGAGLDMRNDRYNPSQGDRLNGFYEQVTGDHTFGVLEGSYVRYFTLHEDILERRTVLMTRVLGATILGDAPPFEKFYAGGTGRYGIRGFEYRGVSTRGYQTGVAVPVRKDPIGSDWVFLAGAELTVPLVGDNFAGLFFVDSGTIDTGSYRLSIGTGIQIMVPQLLGPVPIRFEVSTPLLKDDQDETQVFSFSYPGMF